MELLNKLSKLLPFFKKDTILEDITITLDELTLAITSYKEATDVFKSKNFKTDQITYLSKEYFKTIKSRSSSDTLISDINEKLINVKENLTTVEKQIEELLEKDIIKEGLTALKASLIHSAEYSSFLSRYSLDLLNYIYYYETEDKIEYDEPKKYKEDYVNGNIVMFASIIDVLGSSNKNFEKALEELVNVVVNDNTLPSLSGIYKDSKLSLFPPQTYKGFQGNPIYYIGLAIAEYQANRYKASLEKKKLLELRKLNLENQLKDSPNPKIQNEILAITNHIEAIEFKIHKMEEA